MSNPAAFCNCRDAYAGIFRPACPLHGNNHVFGVATPLELEPQRQAPAPEKSVMQRCTCFHSYGSTTRPRCPVHGEEHLDPKKLYVCNPLTGECAELPEENASGHPQRRRSDRDEVLQLALEYRKGVEDGYKQGFDSALRYFESLKGI